MPTAGFLIALTITLLLSPASALAQPGTPRPGAMPCAVPRRDLTAIVAVLSPPATPAATPQQHHEDHAGGQATPAPIEPVGTPRLLRPELPAGSPASAETVAGLTETMQRYLACANAGDVIGLMSLVSDDFLRQTFASSIVTESDLQAYADAGRAVPADQRRRLVTIRETRQLADGRVAALVDIAPVANDNRAAIDTDLVTFTLVDGRWLIDRYLAGVTFWYGPDATPAP
jgi:hypothetical protein